MASTTKNDWNHLWEKVNWSVIWWFSLAHVPFVYLKRAGFMICTSILQSAARWRSKCFGITLQVMSITLVCTEPYTWHVWKKVNCTNDLLIHSLVLLNRVDNLLINSLGLLIRFLGLLNRAHDLLINSLLLSRLCTQYSNLFCSKSCTQNN